MAPCRMGRQCVKSRVFGGEGGWKNEKTGMYKIKMYVFT